MLNTDFYWIDRVAYSPERLHKLGEEAAKPNSVFSFEDKMGLVSDAMVLARAGYAKTSSALGFIANLRHEKECVFSSNNSLYAYFIDAGVLFPKGLFGALSGRKSPFWTGFGGSSRKLSATK
jgi:hypothetical protein